LYVQINQYAGHFGDILNMNKQAGINQYCFGGIIGTLLILIFACQPPSKDVSDPDFDPSVLKPGKSFPAIGKAVNMDSVGKPQFIPARGEYVEAGKPKYFLQKTNYRAAAKPKIVPAKGKVVQLDALPKPQSVPVIGKKVLSGWQKSQPTQFGFKDNSPFAYLDVEQGLKYPFVLSLLEDRFGRIWFGFSGTDLAMWDGNNIVQFTWKEGLAGRWLSDLLEDDEGRIWIASANEGVIVWDGSFFTHYNFSSVLGSNRVNSLIKDRKGRIWIGTASGIYIWEGGKEKAIDSFTHLTEKEGLLHNDVRTLMEDRQGRIWIGTAQGLCIWDEYSVTHFTSNEGLSNNEVISLLQDKRGQVWLGTLEGGVNVWQGDDIHGEGIFIHFTSETGLIDDQIRSLLEDQNGHIWIGTFGGLSIWIPDKISASKKIFGLAGGFKNYTTANGLSHNQIRSLLEDRLGNIWIASLGGGIHVLKNNVFTHFTSPPVDDIVRCFLEDSKGQIWIGTNEKGLSIYQYPGNESNSSSTIDHEFTNYTTEEGLIHNGVWALLEDRSGNIWIGTGRGVSVWDGKGFRNYSTDDIVQNFYEDKAGRIWICSPRGISIWDSTSNGLLQYAADEGLNYNGVRKILEDRYGNMWMGTNLNGIMVWSTDENGDTSIDRFHIGDGLNSEQILSLMKDPEENIWIGTDEDGVNVWQAGETGIEGRFLHFPQVEAFMNRTVRSMSQDQSGNLWIGAHGALKRINWQAETRQWQIQSFSRPNGLMDVSIMATLVDSKENLWLGGTSSISRMDLKARPSELGQPIILIQELQPTFEFIDWRHAPDSFKREIQYDSVIAFTNLPLDPVFSHQTQDLTIHWSGVQGSAHSQPQYTYFLEGNDAKWSPLIMDNKARFQNLRPGDYTFKLRAVGTNGQWSETVSYAFSIRHPWWQTWWAWLGYLIIAAMCIWAFIRWRTYSLRVRVLKKTQEIRAQQKRSDELLLNILPSEVARELKETGKTQPVFFEDVSILFADFKGFTNIVASIPGKVLVQELDEIFQAYDDIVEEVGLEKIQTVGDAYLAACGLPTPDPDHAKKCVLAAQRIIAFLEKRNQTAAIKWTVRVGIHSGSITAGVIGKKKFAYDLFGDTINVAARIESASEPGRINVSAYTYRLIKDEISCSYRGKIDAKGKGELDMYFVD
jgi:ligand-binding sensor domain-containing protein/class 3 adenylate cyclase